ncbi:MAG: metallophosphoesterase family protein, partial [Planctomycetota bacterium]
MSGTSRVGLIADTHGLLRPEAVEALAGVERIVHAGDVGHAEILTELARLAPVTAVRGNMDHGPWADELPRTAEVEVRGRWLHALHILDDLDLDPATGGFAAVVYGHSHRPSIERRRGVLYVNPGSAGPRRFDLPVSLALLEIDAS